VRRISSTWKATDRDITLGVTLRATSLPERRKKAQKEERVKGVVEDRRAVVDAAAGPVVVHRPDRYGCSECRCRVGDGHPMPGIVRTRSRAITSPFTISS